jgi:hypothetical protein
MTLAIASCLTGGHHAPRHTAICRQSDLPNLPRPQARLCTPRPGVSVTTAALEQGSRPPCRTSRMAAFAPMPKAVTTMNASGSEVA